MLSRTCAGPPQRVASAGFSLVEAMVLVTLVSVIVGAVVGVSIAGARAQRGAHDRQEAILAASDRLGAVVPQAAGGSISPNPPVDGWTDVVYASGGAFVPFERGSSPAAVIVVRRQWRVVAGTYGTRRFDVSAELLNSSTLEPLPGLDGYAVVRSRSVR